jgi:excisionase family DNA binding protein
MIEKRSGCGADQDGKRNVPQRAHSPRRVFKAPDDPSFLVTMPTLCEQLALPLKWVRREVSAGRLPAIRIGRRVCFNISAVKEYLRDRASRRNQAGQWLQ